MIQLTPIQVSRLQDKAREVIKVCKGASFKDMWLEYLNGGYSREKDDWNYIKHNKLDLLFNVFNEINLQCANDYIDLEDAVLELLAMIIPDEVRTRELEFAGKKVRKRKDEPTIHDKIIDDEDDE